MSTLQQAALYATDLNATDLKPGIVNVNFPTSPQVDCVCPNDDFSLTITFKTGEVKRFDVTPFLNGSEFFRELCDPAYFRQAFPDGSAIEWPNGQSLCSDVIYPNGILVAD
jgi:hypothetical protein